MITRLFGGECIDGVSKSEVRDLYLVQDKISSVSTDARLDAEYNLSNHIVVAGGIDLHTHIGGGKVNIARLLLPEMVRHGRSQQEREEQEWQKIAPLSSPVP